MQTNLSSISEFLGTSVFTKKGHLSMLHCFKI